MNTKYKFVDCNEQPLYNFLVTHFNGIYNWQGVFFADSSAGNLYINVPAKPDMVIL